MYAIVYFLLFLFYRFFTFWADTKNIGRFIYIYIYISITDGFFVAARAYKAYVTYIVGRNVHDRTIFIYTKSFCELFLSLLFAAVSKTHRAHYRRGPLENNEFTFVLSYLFSYPEHGHLESSIGWMYNNVRGKYSARLAFFIMKFALVFTFFRQNY